MELAELYREQGRFDESQKVILTLDQRDVGVTSNLIGKLIKEKAIGANALQDVTQFWIFSWERPCKDLGEISEISEISDATSTCG